jgi:predicted amidohydrolase YtcJ
MTGTRRPLREAHCHILAHGEALALPSLRACQTGAAALDEVARCCTEAPPGAWVRFHSARPESWPEGQWPSLHELDEAAGGRPVVLFSLDLHSAMGSSAALAAAGLHAGQRVGEHGVVCEMDGAATGVALEEAGKALWDAAPRPTEANLLEYAAAALADFARLGYRQVLEMHMPPELPWVLARLEREGRLAVDSVLVYAPVRRLRQVWEERREWESERLMLAGGKVFTDGALNSRTAHMLSDYASPRQGFPRGMVVTDGAGLDQAIRIAESVGLPLAIHAIGDAAVRSVLDAVERNRPRAADGAAGAVGGMRHYRVEHCQFVAPEDVGRFAALGLVASVQPCHLLADIEPTRRLLPHVEAGGRVVPLRSMIDSGLEPGVGLVVGSDAPVVRPDPEDSILAATKRRRTEMPEREALGPEQAITEAEAWACFS